MLVGEGDEPRERAVGEPRVGVQDQDVAAGGASHAAVPARREAEVLLLDHPRLREALADELGVPSVEPWSTTTVSSPRTLSRQRSIHGSAL